VLAPRGKNASPIIVPAYQLLFPSIRGFKTWDNPFAPDYQNIDGALGGFLGFWAVLMQAGFSFFGSEVPGIAAGEFGLETDTVQSSKQINRGSDQCDGRKYDFSSSAFGCLRSTRMCRAPYVGCGCECMLLDLRSQTERHQLCLAAHCSTWEVYLPQDCSSKVTSILVVHVMVKNLVATRHLKGQETHHHL
jgi:hypothetical protein